MTRPTPSIDLPGPVRPGEELPVERLQTYLQARFPELQPPLQVEQFPGGHSNLTYLLRGGSKELVLRRPPVGSTVKSAHDMGREHRVLSRLHAVFPLAPAALDYCDDPAVIGAPFFIMQRVEGMILRGPGLPAGLEIAPAAMRRLSGAMVDALADLHRVDIAAAGLEGFGRPEGYVERQVRGWSERYRNATTGDTPELDRIAAWLAERVPPESGAAVIHNDYKYDNLVLDPEEPWCLRAVLDWEMATVGDPLLDLGTTLAYWIDPDDPEEHRQLRIGATALPGNLTRREVMERYAERRAIAVPDPLFYYVYGLFKVAVIVQQIYYRFRRGLTVDPRFAALGHVAAVLGRTGWKAVERGRIDRLG